MGIELAAPVYSSLSSVFFNTNTNMSWQPYIDDHLLQALPQGGSLTHAAIFGQDGNAWANSPEFPVPDPAYVKKLVAAIDDAGALGDAGLKFGEIKYIMVQGETGAVIRGERGVLSSRRRRPLSLLVSTVRVCSQATATCWL